MNWKEQPNLIRELAGARPLEVVISLASASGGQPDPGVRQPAAEAINFKRLFDAFFSAVGIIVLSPVFLLIALAVKLSDGGPVFYRQTRIGQHGIPFRIWKFRTMVPNAEQSGPPVTGSGDSRVTRVGRFLRRAKLDELPQLWNVLCGEMSLVGPRPEVPRYVEYYTFEQRGILQYKPGITDLASLHFRDEESLLKSCDDTEQFYIQQCVPRKLKLNQDYARQANLLTDTWIILRTVCPYWTGVLGAYALILVASFWFSAALVSNFGFSSAAWHQLSAQLGLTVGLQLLCLLRRRQCKGLLCYFGLPELSQVTLGLVQSSLILLGLGLSPFSRGAVPPQNLTLIDFFISLLWLSGFRVLLRLWRERTEGLQPPQGGYQRRVGIIGAGSLGAELARWFNTQKNFGRIAVAFFDDDFGKWQKQIHEVPVVGMPECLLQGWSERLDEVAIALPDASPARLEQINQLFQKTNLKVYTIQWPLPAWTEQQMPHAADDLCAH
jgi:lipopolysaccharide/colanic/teichoic acid biosynthesis glycosyltransferase